MLLILGLIIGFLGGVKYVDNEIKKTAKEIERMWGLH